MLLAAVLALTGCSESGGSGSSSHKAAGSAPRRDVPATGNGGGGYADRGTAPGSGATAAPKAEAPAAKIVRTASLTVEVRDVAKALAAARAAAQDAGGYVGDEDTSRDTEGRERTRVVLRVPVDRYDALLARLEGTGRLVERSARAEDVTGQVVDVDSRIRSQRASVARVRALMDKAGSLGDVVSLESELSRREADLEALLAQQASLKDRTSLATVTLSLSSASAPAHESADDGPGFLDALAGGWHVFVTVVRWLALALGAVLPFAAAAALLTVLWLRAVRPRLPRRAASGAPVTAPGALGAPAPAGPGLPVHPATPAAPATPAPAAGTDGTGTADTGTEGGGADGDRER
ncbi:DUF4349 domain-containing protein [Streptomyces sp. NPDC018057]|uniref:DUF4349 domain-containing protein n=1 Tax=unclassified Streptomyces TaxID=2593676 RepID=UPI00378BCE2F